MTNEEYKKKLKEIEFFKKHPEYIPFVGEDYDKYKILQVAESHYIPNFKKDTIKYDKLYKANAITYKDYEGWWEEMPTKLAEFAAGWFTTDSVVKNYMAGERTKAHGVFNNPLRSFCSVLEPDKTFENINDENSQCYNHFAYMNFWQMPSIYYGQNFSKALYDSIKFLNPGLSRKELNRKYDDEWYKCFFKSVEVFEAVVEALEPDLILITSNEVGTSYKTYGTRVTEIGDAKYVDRNGYRFNPGLLDGKKNMVYLDHPGSSWWNCKKDSEEETSKERLEKALKDLKK